MVLDVTSEVEATICRMGGCVQSLHEGSIVLNDDLHMIEGDLDQRRSVPPVAVYQRRMPNEQDWKAEFRRLLLADGVESLSEAIALKDAHAPEKLFKFFRPTDYAFDGLQNDSLYLAPPVDFNDPYDSGVTMSGPQALVRALVEGPLVPDWSELGDERLSQEDFLSVVEGRVSDEALQRFAAMDPDTPLDDMRKVLGAFPLVVGQLFQQMAGQMQTGFQQRLKVTCFTEQATTPVLWAHYADNHAGFCVEYAYADIPSDLPQRRLLFPVIYQSERFDLNATMRRGLAGDLPNLSLGIAASLHKSPEWAYEREWRMVNPDGREGGLTVPFVTPRRVVAGMKMSPEHLARLTEICGARGIALARPSLSPMGYDIVL